MNVVWSAAALAHLTAIFEFIAKDSPSYALRVIDRLTDRSGQLARFPESGHVVPEYSDPSLREVIEGPYRIIYRIEPERVVIVSVIHGARILPGGSQ
jgi:plasmid stabilization system protein ParE